MCRLVCQRESWYTTVLHLQWSLLRKELLVPVEQDSCAAACVLQCCACLGHWAWLGVRLVPQPACRSPGAGQRPQVCWLLLPAPVQTLP